MLVLPDRALRMIAAGAMVRLLNFVVQVKRIRQLPLDVSQGLLDLSCELASRAGGSVVDEFIDHCGERALALLPLAVRYEHRPCWLATARELWHCGVLIKKFKGPADNQEPVLDAMEAAGWPSVSLNPFTGPGAAQRLEMAVKGLNRRLRQPLIRFRIINEGAKLCCDLKKPAESVPQLEKSECPTSRNVCRFSRLNW